MNNLHPAFYIVFILFMITMMCVIYKWDLKHRGLDVLIATYKYNGKVEGVEMQPDWVYINEQRYGYKTMKIVFMNDGLLFCQEKPMAGTIFPYKLLLPYNKLKFYERGRKKFLFDGSLPYLQLDSRELDLGDEAYNYILNNKTKLGFNK